MTNDEAMCQLCTRPTKDTAYLCEDCGDTFVDGLKDLADWLDEDLETSISGTKGVRYQFGHVRGSGDEGLRVNWRAAELYRRLHRALSEAVDHCLEVDTRHRSPRSDEPSRSVGPMALWLTWRVDGLCLDPKGSKHARRIGQMVTQAKELVFWVPPEQRFLGPCEVCGAGHVYAEGEDAEALCNRCEAAFPAEARRVGLLAKMDDRLLTSAEIADVTTYLGLRDSRQRVQWRVSQWHARKRVSSKGLDAKGHPTFRFGDVYPMLLLNEAGKTGG